MTRKRRWVVERTVAWLRRCRRLARPQGMRSIKDFKATLASAIAWVLVAHIRRLRFIVLPERLVAPVEQQRGDNEN